MWFLMLVELPFLTVPFSLKLNARYQRFFGPYPVDDESPGPCIFGEEGQILALLLR